MLDAYTVRKAVPRILLAAIGINISIYLCVAMIDIVNIIGSGLADLIVAPFRNAEAFGNASLDSNLWGVGFALGLVATGGTIWALGGAPAVGFGLIALLVPLVISMALISLAIIFTLVIRQALIIFLTIISPVAIACFVLPGTEKYFKRWLDLYVKTLMVYPIIAAIFAVSTAMVSILVGTAGASPGAIGFTKAIAAVIVAFLPLVLIPFAFKLAGGAIGAVMSAGAQRAGGLSGRAAKGYAGMRQNPNSLIGGIERNSRKNRADRSAIQYNRGVAQGNTLRGRFNRLAGGKYSSFVQADENTESEKRVQSLAQAGNDELVRASTIDINSIRGTAREQRDAAGNATGRYMAADGRWYTAQQVEAGRGLIKTQGDQQAAFKHVLSKTENLPAENQQMVVNDFLAYANREGLDVGSASGAWAATAIPNQRIRQDIRNTSMRVGADGKTLEAVSGHAALLDSLGTQQGYALASQQEGTFEAAAVAYREQHSAYQNAIANGKQDEASLIADRMHNAKENLRKYVGVTGTRAVPRAGEDGSLDPGSAYGGASSASYKSEQAARKALAEIDFFDSSGGGVAGVNPPARPYSGGRAGDRARPRDNQDLPHRR